MIIKGGRAGNVGFWSGHLLRTDTNARAELKEARGVVADDLRGALREMQAVASASRCGPDFMYQANINPLAHEHLTPEQWATAIDTLEKNLGFEGHARIVVEHVKEGRQHVHVIWNRVDDELRTVSPWRNYDIHERTARQLEREFELEPTPENGAASRSFALWELQRAEETRIDPRDVKADVSQLWQRTDSGQAFAAALDECGYALARGDRRDFCIVDHAGTVHSLARRLEGVNAAEVRARMADVDRAALPTVAEASARQHDRFPDPAEAFASRGLSRAPDDQSHELAGMSGPTSSQPFMNGPATRLDQEEEKARAQNAGAGASELDWTDRAGMAAQQRSALEWAERARERREEQRAEDLGRGERAPDPRAEISDRRAETTDAQAGKSDLDIERARFLAQRARQRSDLERDRDGGREL